MTDDGAAIYSVSVAIFDYFPVLFSALGLVLLAQAISARHRALAPVAWGAALLIPFGGLCKASWKLIMALSHQNVAWLENLLFISMAPGFVAMAFSLMHASRAWQAGIEPSTARYSHLHLLAWLAVPLLGGCGAALLFPGSRIWFFYLLGITTAASVTLIIHAIKASRIAGLRWAGLLFAYNLLATLTLGGLSRLPPGEASAWIQESVNLSAQAAFAWAAWQLRQHWLSTATRSGKAPLHASLV